MQKVIRDIPLWKWKYTNIRVVDASEYGIAQLNETKVIYMVISPKESDDRVAEIIKGWSIMEQQRRPPHKAKWWISKKTPWTEDELVKEVADRLFVVDPVEGSTSEEVADDVLIAGFEELRKRGYKHPQRGE